MALSESQIQYVRSLSSLVKKYNQQYQIHDECVVAIVAQSCNESAWGRSKLSTDYYNLWGMTCGSGWTGESVNFETWEEYPSGMVKVNTDFRAYDSFENGVIGYFEFIQYPRYHNLRDCLTPREYLQTIKDDGYATSSSYVQNIMAIVNQIDYLVNETEPDSNPQPPPPPPPYGSEPATYSVIVQVALECLTGQWGNAIEDIKHNLDVAGYDIDEIMEAIGGCIGAVYRKRRKRGRKK